MAFFEIKNLSFNYEDQTILEDVSFQANRGDLIALVGPSGCGKTTLLKIIVGILSHQRGSIIIDGVEITRIPIEKRSIGYVPQNQGLFPHLKTFENIAFGLTTQDRATSTIHKRVLELADMSDLVEVLDRKPHELSGGQQQRVALLRALAPYPKLLLLDEPLSNVDAQLREQLAIYIRNMQIKSKITTVFVTHDLEEAKMLADKIVVISEGKVIQAGSTKDVTLKPHSIEVATTLGLKNLYKVREIIKTPNEDELALITEIGKILVSNQDSIVSTDDIKGLYINPRMIDISREPFNVNNSLKGKVVAVIPEPMLLQAAVLITIYTDDYNKSNSSKILRTQIPIDKCDYRPSDDIYVKINRNSVQFFR